MEVIYILVPAGILFLGGSALLAFFWAVRTGQLRNLNKGAEVIFDEGEPIGTPTDRFPGARATRKPHKDQA